MATNFVLTTTARIAAPVTAGAYLVTKDQAPTAAWVEVDFGAVPENSDSMQTRERVLQIATDAALRYFVGAAAPAGGEVGALVLANSSRAIAFAAGNRLWIKT